MKTHESAIRRWLKRCIRRAERKNARCFKTVGEGAPIQVLPTDENTTPVEYPKLDTKVCANKQCTQTDWNSYLASFDACTDKANKMKVPEIKMRKWLRKCINKAKRKHWKCFKLFGEGGPIKYLKPNNWPKPQPKPEPIPEPTPEPEVSEPEPVPEPKPEVSEPEPVPEPKPEVSEPEPTPEPMPEPKPKRKRRRKKPRRKRKRRRRKKRKGRKPKKKCKRKRRRRKRRRRRRRKRKGRKPKNTNIPPHLAEKMKNAKTPAEYHKYHQQWRKLFNQWKKKNPHCITPPEPAPVNMLPPIESACQKGYKIGFSQGQKWAQLITRSGGSFMNGKHELRCLLKFLKKKSNIYHLCAIKGAKQGYKKFHRLYTNPQALKKYQDAQEQLKRVNAANDAYYDRVENSMH